MAEILDFSAIQHIETMIEEELDVGPFKSKAMDVKSELAEITRLVVEANEEFANGEVQYWLAQLRLITYDAEDTVYTYVSESSSKWFSRISRRSQSQSQQAAVHLVDQQLVKMREIKAYLDRRQGEVSSVAQTRRTNNNSHTMHNLCVDDFVVGIWEDVEKLIKELINGSHFRVLVIGGIGGSGKTTMAKCIYNHEHIKQKFHYKVWLTLYQGLTIPDAIYDILGKLRVNHMMDGGGKRCLVVLDNVWDREWDRGRNRDCQVLQEILRVLQHLTYNLHTTKIVITSRQKELLPQGDSTIFYHEMQLFKNEEDAWRLFTNVSGIFNRVDELTTNDNNADVLMLMELVKNCRGLPLAIVVLGRYFQNMDTTQKWEQVYSRMLARVNALDVLKPVSDILASSYDNLPYYLKSCFLYFGLFPEDYIIPAGTLVRMWVAEGFKLPLHHTTETLEAQAKRFLQKLTDHRMVQVVDQTYDGKAKTLEIDNAMRNFCILKARELDLLLASSSESAQQRTQSNPRRATVDLRKCPITLPIDNSNLRSMLLYEQGVTVHTERNSLLALVFEKFRLLRVLDINGIKTFNGVMPKEIGNLIHLRYLRIRSTNIRELPKSIVKLSKLLIFDYRNVSAENNEIILPNVLGKLRHLRHLYLPACDRMGENLELHTIKDLQTLWGVKGGNWMLKEMPNLRPTLKKLGILRISTSQLIDSVFNSPIIKHHDCHLHTLSLDWYGFSVEVGVLDALRLNTSLKKLKLKGKAPDDVTDAHLRFPSNLEKLELYYTQLNNPQSLLALGELMHLKTLNLANDSYMGFQWIVRGRAVFPKLEELNLSSLPSLEKLEIDHEEGMMPCFKKLSILSCSNLRHTPQNLRNLTTNFL